MVKEMSLDEQYSEELRRIAGQSLKSAENKELLNVGKRIIHSTLYYPDKVRKMREKVLNDPSLNAKKKHNKLRIIDHIAEAYLSETKDKEQDILRKIKEHDHLAERRKEFLKRHGRL
jgi:hypothetical protein